MKNLFLAISLLAVPMTARAVYTYEDLIAPMLPRCPGFMTGDQTISISAFGYNVWEGGRHSYFVRCIDAKTKAVREETLNLKKGSADSDPSQLESITKNNVVTCGSIIKIDNRSVGEVLSVTGTNLKLYYWSNRVIGRKLESAFKIPLYDPNPNVTGFSVSGTYADGRTFNESFPNFAGQHYLFAWDGKDSLGNVMANGTQLNFIVKYLVHGQEVDVSYSAQLRSPKMENSGIGGWHPDIVHRFDQTSGVLSLGSGGINKTVAYPQIGGYRVYAEDGSEVYVFNGLGQHTSTLFGLTGATKYAFTYDGIWGSISSVTDSNGKVTTFAVDPSSGRVTSITSPKGLVTELEYDGNGYLSEFTNPAGETHSMTYNSEGLILTFRKPEGETSTFAHDALGALISDKHSGGSSTALTHRIDTTDYPYKEVIAESTLGRIKRVESSQAYMSNDQGRFTYREKELNSYTRYESTALVTSNSFFSQSTSLRSDPRYGSKVKFPGRVVTKVGNSQIVEENIREVASVNPADVFDFSGLIYKNIKDGNMSISTYDKDNRTWTTTSAEGRVSSRKIDATERVTQLAQGSLAPVQFTYNADGNLSKITQGQRVTSMNYDSRGYLSQQINALGEMTNYTRDDEGRTLSVTDGAGRRTRYTYDQNGRMTTLITPNNRTHGFSYNDHELLERYEVPNLQGSVSYGYTPDKEFGALWLPDGRAANYTYDNIGRLISKGVWFEGLYLYEYDSIGRVSNVIRTNGVRLQKEYHGKLLKTERQYPEDGGPMLAQVQIGYDRELRPAKIYVKDNINSVAHIPYITYDRDELMKQVGSLSIARNGNGSVTEKKIGNSQILYSYDSTYGELNKIEYRHNGRTQFIQNFNRDKLGRISEMDSNTGRLVLHYDRAGRFVGRTPKGATQPYSKFVYDTNGNRVSGFEGDKTFAATYDAQDRLTRYNSTRFTYNLNGDLQSRIEDGIATYFTYDVFGNLNKVSRSGMEIEYLIDGHDRRVAKKVNGRITTRYIWENQLRIAAELEPSGKLRQQYVYADGVNSPEYMVFQGKKYLFVKDHRGSVNLVVDADTGEVKQRMQYSEFGEVTEDTNPGFQPFGFAGGLYDPETKLVRFGARDYDSRIGRWLAKDPIRFEGGTTNLYEYTLNDPINLIDPRGTFGYEAGLSDFWEDVKDAADKMEDTDDALEAIRKLAYCKMFPKDCGTDPAEKPFDEKDYEPKPKNQCQ